MKKNFLWGAMIMFSVTLYAQTATTGKIDSLKDVWGETITYVGEIKTGKPNGLGLAIYHNDFVLRYAGYFVNGKYEGKGAMIFKDGSFLSGDWKAGKLNGQGANFNKDKDLYIGGFLNGEKSGFGTFMFKDNSFLQGSFKADNYNGRCIYINKEAKTVADNIYVDGKKEGPGYQYEVDNKKLFEGRWSNGDWVESTTGNYNTFLKDSRFYGEKTDNQVIMGCIEKNNDNMLEDTCFYYDLKKNKRYFGYNHNGLLEKGLIIKDDSTRLIGSFNDDGAYGYCHFLKLGKYYDEGTYVKDYLNGAKNLSINIDKKTIYYGQMIGEAEFTGKAWFASSSNDLYNGDYLDGKFTGSGWRIDKTGYQVKGTWDDGDIKTLTSILNNKGETVNVKPKTLSEALSIAYNAYPGEFLGIQGNDNYGDDYDWLELFYESMISFPGTSATDLIASDYDEYWYYVATYAQTEGFDEAKAKYNELCKQVAAATITFKKGANPAKLTGEIKAADEETDFILTEFELPASINDPNDFGVSVVLKKNIDDKYIVMIVCGDNYGVSNWEE